MASRDPEATSEEKYIPQQYQFDPKDFYPWQKDVMESCNGICPLAEHINYVHSPNGNIGKSLIACWLDLNGHGIVLPPYSARLILKYVNNYLVSRNERHPKAFLLDLPCATSRRALPGIISAMETLKKGVCYDYKGREWYYDPPAIWVFSNELPRADQLYQRKWRVWQVNGDREFEPLADW
jgi:hypothetical protein